VQSPKELNALWDKITTLILGKAKKSEMELAANTRQTEQNMVTDCHVFKREGWKNSVVENRPQLKS